VGTLFSVAYVVLALLSFVFAVINVDPFERVRSTGDGSLWARISRFVMKYPAPLAAVTTIVLLAIGSIYFTINLGQSGISTLPHDSSPYRAFTLLSNDFSQLSLEEPNHVVVQAADVNAPEVQGAIDTLMAEAAQDGQFGPATVTVNGDGTVASVAFPSLTDTQSGEALASIERLRNEYVPTAFNGVNADTYVTGPSAFTVDFNSIVDTYTPIVFGFVLTVSLVLLLLAFRSLVVPVKSVIMNLLSVGASYGLLVLVFQHGYGHELLGFQQVERIDAWVPLMMFTILFGLSMDYHVFLLSRIKERYDLTQNNTESVAYGVRTTANIITGAALIMVAVFGGFAMGELSMFQQMGFGLAVAVILDATVIRSILVPATMRLLGKWNWYFPSWLEWLPKINVEGVEEAPQQAPAGVAAD
jgi:RND superfamily putative drug exporter